MIKINQIGNYVNVDKIPRFSGQGQKEKPITNQELNQKSLFKII